MKFVVYEIYTRAHLVEAETSTEALQKHKPKLEPGLHLSNWHAAQVPEPVTAAVVPAKTKRTRKPKLIQEFPPKEVK